MEYAAGSLIKRNPSSVYTRLIVLIVRVAKLRHLRWMRHKIFLQAKLPCLFSLLTYPLACVHPPNHFFFRAHEPGRRNESVRDVERGGETNPPLHGGRWPAHLYSLRSSFLVSNLHFCSSLTVAFISVSLFSSLSTLWHKGERRRRNLESCAWSWNESEETSDLFGCLLHSGCRMPETWADGKGKYNGK